MCKWAVTQLSQRTAYIYTSGQHIMLLNQWRVRPLTPLFCSAICWSDGGKKRNWLSSFKYQPSKCLVSCFFFCFFISQKIQHHNSTGAASTVQGRLLCWVRRIQSSSWPDRGHHRDVCSVGLKDQHPLAGNTRVQGTAPIQEPSTALILLKQWTDQTHINTFFFPFCNLFSLWRTKYYKSTGNIRK